MLVMLRMRPAEWLKVVTPAVCMLVQYAHPIPPFIVYKPFWSVITSVIVIPSMPQAQCMPYFVVEQRARVSQRPISAGRLDILEIVVVEHVFFPSAKRAGYPRPRSVWSVKDVDSIQSIDAILGKSSIYIAKICVIGSLVAMKINACEQIPDFYLRRCSRICLYLAADSAQRGRWPSATGRHCHPIPSWLDL